MPDFYSVTDLAQEFSITPRAIRFYEAKGLLEPERVGTTRVYDYRDHARLQLVLRGKRLGFSLSDIREYLALYDLDTGQLEQCRLLVGKIDRRLSELERQREDIDAALDELRDMRAQAQQNIGQQPSAESA